MRGKYRISHLLLPTYRHKYPPFSSISLTRMVLFSPTMIPHWQIMITQCIVHSWCPYFNIFYGFGQMSSNIYIHNHAKYFHCPKNYLCSDYSSLLFIWVSLHPLPFPHFQTLIFLKLPQFWLFQNHIYLETYNI